MKSLSRAKENLKLILVSGPPGAGKSTLSRALARELPAVLLDKDAIDEPFSPNKRDAHYNLEIEPNVLQGLIRLAELNLGAGQSVILDAPWTHILLNDPSLQDQLAQLADRSQSQLVALECVLPEEELKKRIQQRGLERDQNKLSDAGWASFRERDRLGDTNPLPHHIIDMQQDRDVCLRIALNFLQS